MLKEKMAYFKGGGLKTSKQRKLTNWFWYAVTPMKFVSEKVNVFISSDLRLITEAVWSRLRIMCTLG